MVPRDARRRAVLGRAWSPRPASARWWTGCAAPRRARASPATSSPPPRRELARAVTAAAGGRAGQRRRGRGRGAAPGPRAAGRAAVGARGGAALHPRDRLRRRPGLRPGGGAARRLGRPARGHGRRRRSPAATTTAPWSRAPRRWAGRAAGRLAVLVGPGPGGGPAPTVVDAVHTAARRLGTDVLAGVHDGAAAGRAARGPGRRPRRRPARSRWSGCFGGGPVVVGTDGGRAAQRAHLGRGLPWPGCGAAPAWPDAPRPVAADALLAERALHRRPQRRAPRLVEDVYIPLRDADLPLLETVATYLEQRRRARGHLPAALRAPEHRPLPPAQGRDAHRDRPRRTAATRSRCGSRSRWAGSRDAPTRHEDAVAIVVGHPQQSRRGPCPLRHRCRTGPHRRRWSRARHRLARTGLPDRRTPPSRGSPCPGSRTRLGPWSAAAGARPRRTSAPTADAETSATPPPPSRCWSPTALLSAAAVAGRRAPATAVHAGHSVGELAALALAGALTPTEAVVAAAVRGRGDGAGLRREPTARWPRSSAATPTRCWTALTAARPGGRQPQRRRPGRRRRPARAVEALLAAPPAGARVRRAGGRRRVPHPPDGPAPRRPLRGPPGRPAAARPAPRAADATPTAGSSPDAEEALALARRAGHLPGPLGPVPGAAAATSGVTGAARARPRRHPGRAGAPQRCPGSRWWPLRGPDDLAAARALVAAHSRAAAEHPAPGFTLVVAPQAGILVPRRPRPREPSSPPAGLARRDHQPGPRPRSLLAALRRPR